MHSAMDMFGTEFMYPNPVCPVNTFYNLQMIPRGYDPVMVTINDRQLLLSSYKVTDTGTMHYGDLRNGKSMTASMQCSLYEAEGRVRDGQS